MFIASCFRNCFDSFRLVSAQHEMEKKERENVIGLDDEFACQEVVLLKNASRVCGRGGVLGNAPLIQSKSYFEVKILQDGYWSVGIASRSTNLESCGGDDSESWCLDSLGEVKHNKVQIHKLQKESFQEGDIIGVSYDHVELNFYLNGKSLEVPVIGIKGTTFPALHVDNGAILDLIVENFVYTPPMGFDKIMLEQSLL
ncbi:unnamed protein product [Trichogramma brassicae]|uniref:SPRY domain-containing protein 7 n=1 Tax=Trichogramma brassicae TaxID=86971 RepID=A0A6H5IJM2_9HYME|nr:unnamed protein product [Trichogramma brassicae]